MWDQTGLGAELMGQRRKRVQGTWAQADIFSSPLNGKQEPDRLAPRWALMAEDQCYQTLGTGWEVERALQGVQESRVLPLLPIPSQAWT